MTIRYTHTNFVAHDWRKLASFYEDVFDCKPVPPERDLEGEWLDNALGLPNAGIKGMHLRLPGCGENGPTLEIFQYSSIIDSPDTQANTKGITHIAFHVDDVDAIFQKVLDHGGSALGKVTRKTVEGVGELTVVYMKDPEGNIVEIQNWS